MSISKSDNPIKSKTVLMVELNECHGECLPGYIKYFQDLGYEIDVLLNEMQREENPLCMFNDIHVTYASSRNIIKYLNTNMADKYDLCLFNSDIIYDQSSSIISLIKPQVSFPKILCVEHNLEYVPILSKKAIPIALRNLNNSELAFEVNPHYFGEYPYHNKGSVTNFIVVGSIESDRRNYGMLISAVNQLINEKVSNFRITIIGKGNINDIPNNIRSYFDIKGRLTYPDMYAEMSKADYFLTLLDPENPRHNRYLKYGTSGSFQLIYGFNIPCLLVKKFAAVHSFDDKNSIIYENNLQLSKAMLAAINQNDVDYRKMKKELKILSDNIYQSSLNHLQDAVEADIIPESSKSYPRLFFLYYIIAKFVLQELKKRKNSGQSTTAKTKPADEKISFKKFLYHQVRTHSSIKTYILGIKVKKQKIKTDEQNNVNNEIIEEDRNSSTSLLQEIWNYPIYVKEKYDRLIVESKLWKEYRTRR